MPLGRKKSLNLGVIKELIIEETHPPTSEPFVLSTSKHERLGHEPFDRLRVNCVLFFSGVKEREFA